MPMPIEPEQYNGGRSLPLLFSRIYAARDRLDFIHVSASAQNRDSYAACGILDA